MRLFTALLPALVALMAAGNGAWAADEIEPSVVKLAVTKREPDYLRPWTKASPSKVTGSGAVIAGGRILTNAHVVMHASEVFIQLREGGDQHTARVLAVAPGMDLALIEPVDPSLLASVPPLELADELPRLKSQVSVYGYPTGGEDLSITNGIVSRVEFTNYNFGAAGVRVQVDAALNPGNSGGPAIQDGRIIGLVFSGIREADNIGYLIPTEEIQTFLADVSDGAYDGKPSIFESYQTAENDAVRAFLEMTPETTGIIIADTTEGDDYPLRRWDVITHVGAHAVDNQGYVAVRDGLRLKFLYYVQKLAVDGFVELTILRDGESQIVRVPVAEGSVSRILHLRAACLLGRHAGVRPRAGINRPGDAAGTGQPHAQTAAGAPIRTGGAARDRRLAGVPSSDRQG
ncbi:MAG TPA: S1C family serine protease, partial [Lacipirellulaceae bacterium]|nr:S1C family serine protease [Lacipirellulaceae bacterium]